MRPKGISVYFLNMLVVLILCMIIFVPSQDVVYENSKLKIQNDSLKSQVVGLQEKNVLLQEENSNLKFYYRAFYVDNRVYKVTVTGYHPTIEQCDSTPNITADGTEIEVDKASEYRYIALSRDLLKKWGGEFNYGNLIYIHGMGKVNKKGVYEASPYDGIYQIRDTMNQRHKRCADILLTPGEKSFYRQKIYMRKVTVIHEYTFADVFGSIKLSVR